MVSKSLRVALVNRALRFTWILWCSVEARGHTIIAYKCTVPPKKKKIIIKKLKKKKKKNYKKHLGISYTG